MSLLTIQEYCKHHHITDRTYRRWQNQGVCSTIPGTSYVYTKEPIFQLTDSDKEIILQSKIEKWKADLKNAHNIYKLENKPTKITTAVISAIASEVKYLKNIGFNVPKGYDKRPLQIKVKEGKIDRQNRDDKFKIRNQNVRYSFQKAIDLIGNLYFNRAIPSVNEAIDRAIYYAKQNEEFYEVAGCEKHIHTLRRHIRLHMQMGGFKNFHDFINHHNKHRSKLAYVKGAFTDDINFFDVISLDDHKFDVAGVYEWDETEGKWKQKQIHSWFVVELKTMMPLAYEIKTRPFTADDIIKLLMRVFRQYGKPNWKVIYDNGRIVNNERVGYFLERMDIVYEAQEAYSPTQKSPNERLYGLVKNEADVYNNDFVGSNHPVEGRHKGRKLSPEATLRTMEMAIKDYDNYINGYLIDRPRTRNIKALPKSQLDNSGRISIRKLYDYYYPNHVMQTVTDINLRYAYMKYDVIVSFKKFYITFKKELYMPVTDFSLVLNDPSFKFYVGYDPCDFNKIDLYACQDILDMTTGELIYAGKTYICSLESIANLESGEKMKKVTIYNKKMTKAYNELAASMRDKYSLHKNISSEIVGDQGLIDIRKEQVKQVENIIKNAIPVNQIDHVLEVSAKTNDNIDTDEALSEDSINDLNSINIDNL